MNCCKTLVDGIMQELPFERTIARGFYDGPTEGFAECSECRTTYSFRKLDWDDLQNVRITGFAPLQIDLNAIATRLGINEVRAGRLLLIPPLSAPLERYAKELLANHPTYVAAIISGWPGRSRVWRDICRLDLQNVKDWFSFLGIPKETPLNELDQ